MRQLKRAIVLAPAMILVAGCASILDIGDPGFALLEGGVATDGGSELPPGLDPDAGEGGGGEDAPGGEDGPQQCRPGVGVVCPGPCLDKTICGHCPNGTTNVAWLGKASSNSGGPAPFLNDLKVGSPWFAPAGFTGQRDVALDFESLRTVQRVVVYGIRQSIIDVDLVKELTIEVFSLTSSKTSPTLTTLSNGDVTWDLAPAPAVYKVILHIISTANDGAPGIAEIEICGK